MSSFPSYIAGKKNNLNNETQTNWIACIKTSWHSYRQTVVRLGQMLLDCLPLILSLSHTGILDGTTPLNFHPWIILELFCHRLVHIVKM